MDEIKIKQQVVEKIKESSKILVTVSNSPSVDALSAALALTMLLDKQEKYATSIFSGETPPAIAFLEPEKTFDDTTDSLRDFIIALNKEKADHLRYKVEGDSVKIFITPYKTTIDQSDLEFSQGDYNVELVIALGVNNQEHLDGALENHGQILHDAAIITMTSGDQTSDLGGIDWHDSNSSSLSEMVAGLAEALKVDKKKPLLDEQIATALLTGIVAETDRFSNEHTTSKAMTVAASLMAAGADQQLIANELQASREIEAAPVEESTEEVNDENDENDESEDSSENDSDVEVDKDSDDGSMTIKKEYDATALEIVHEDETLADLDRRVRGDEEAKERVIKEVELAEEQAAEEERREHEAYAPPAVTEVEPQSMIGTAYEPEAESDEPVLGGTLNATAEQAADDARRAAENDQNKTILEHSYLGGDDNATISSPSNVIDTPEGFPGTPDVAPGSTGVNNVPSGEDVHSAYAPEGESTLATGSPLGISGERVIQPLSAPPEPVTPVAAYGPELLASAPAPNPTPVDLGLPLPPPIPDFSQVNAGGAPAMPLPPTQQPAILGDILAPEPSSFTTLNAVADPNTAYAPVDMTPTLPPLAPDAQQAPGIPVAPQAPEAPQPPQNTQSDPTQFQIPSA